MTVSVRTNIVQCIVGYLKLWRQRYSVALIPIRPDLAEFLPGAGSVFLLFLFKSVVLESKL